MEQIEKFLRKLNKQKKAELLALIQVLQSGRIPQNADIKPLQRLKNYYRIRKGKIRLIFQKEKEQIGIVKIDYRKDIY